MISPTSSGGAPLSSGVPRVVDATDARGEERLARAEAQSTTEPARPSAAAASDPAEPFDLTSDHETLAMVFEAIRLLAAGVAVTYLGHSIYNLTRLETQGVLPVLLLDQAALLVAALIFGLAHTRRVPEAWVHVLSAVLALNVAVNTAVSVRVYGDSSDLQYMIAVAIGVAAIVVSARWLAVLLSATLGLALWGAVGVCSIDELVDVTVSQAGATLLAVIIFLGRVRGQRKVLRFRLRDAQTARELKETLARAEREFQEHQESERQRLELMEQLRQAQKLEALGTLAGGVAHDINNVIGAITAIASTMVKELPSGALGRRELKQILVAARRGTTLTRNLVRFARQDQPRNAPFSVDDVVTEVESLLQRTLAKHITLRADCGCQGWAVTGDSGLIGHALMNLCLNAAEAIDERGSITIRTRTVELDALEALQLGVPPGRYVELLVADDGQGMTPEVLERAFEPFFSTKDGKRRSGLGLPMVYGTVQQHGGGLRIESRPVGGTRIRLVLPAFARTEAPSEERIRKVPHVDSLRPLALFVDDELLLRKAGKRMLISLGYEVVLASDGREALERFELHRHRIGVVVLDVAMPVMSGADCCRELRRIDPSIPVILASGFPKGHDLKSLLASPNTRYMRKPYELDDLAANLTDLGEAYRQSIRLSCQVNLVRISMPAQRMSVEPPLQVLPISRGLGPRG